MLRVATFNVNGIRAVHRRGFAQWLDTRGCDVVALQEVRAPVAALPERAFGGYHAAYDPGHLAGRNGVAILTRVPPAAIRSWGDPVTVLDPSGAVCGVAEGAAAAYPLARELRAFAHQGRYVEVDLADLLPQRDPSQPAAAPELLAVADTLAAIGRLREPLPRVAAMLIEGDDPGEIAGAFGVSPSRVSQWRGELRAIVARALCLAPVQTDRLQENAP